MEQPTKTNYLSNKDMLEEIYKTKLSFCQIEDPKYARYDAIVHNLEDIFEPEKIALAIETRANRLSTEAYQAKLAQFRIAEALDPKIKSQKPKAKDDEFFVDPASILPEDLVFRLVTWEHIPEEEGRKKNPKKTADHHAKLNFIPFKHYIITDYNARKTKEVVRSHWKNNKYDLTCGEITPKLAGMFLLLVNRYAQRSNWRGYTYVDEMKGQALLQLSVTGLLFDEFKSENPFSYFTAIVSNSFTSILNGEKKHQSLRDDLLQEHGKNPSYTRQLEHEGDMRRLREDLESQFTNGGDS